MASHSNQIVARQIRLRLQTFVCHLHLHGRRGQLVMVVGV